MMRQIKSLHRYTLLSGIGEAGLTNEDSRSIRNRDKNRYLIQMGIAEIDLCGVDRCKSAKPKGQCWLAE